jgi:hypothetical protein
MIVRVKVSRERETETLKELTGDAGFDPKLEDGWLVWKFNSRERGHFFATGAKYTSGVAVVEMGV